MSLLEPCTQRTKWAAAVGDGVAPAERCPHTHTRAYRSTEDNKNMRQSAAYLPRAMSRMARQRRESNGEVARVRLGRGERRYECGNRHTTANVHTHKHIERSTPEPGVPPPPRQRLAPCCPPPFLRAPLTIIYNRCSSSAWALESLLLLL